MNVILESNYVPTFPLIETIFAVLTQMKLNPAIEASLIDIDITLPQFHTSMDQSRVGSITLTSSTAPRPHLF